MILFGKGRENDKLNLFALLGKELKKQNNQVKMLVFNLSEKYIYTKNNSNIIIVEKKITNEKSLKYTDEEIEDIILYEQKIKKIAKNKLIDIAKKYLKVLEKINENEKIEMCIMWNTSYLFDRALYRFCQKNKIKYFVLENGYFRPFTLSVDKKGANYESSIKEQFEKNKNKIKLDENQLKENLYLNTLEKNYIKRNYNFIIFYTLRIIDKCLYYKQNKFFDISETGLFSHLKKINSLKKIKIDKKELEAEYIFVPFQVENDSQIILNSNNIKKMKDLFEIISNSVEEINKKKNRNLKCIFKTHPVDKNINLDEILKLEKLFKNSKIITEGNTKELIKHSKLVITINSTVGIEALVLGKPVITLGDAFYNINNIATKCENLNKLDKCIILKLNEKINKYEINKFLYYLRFYYFKEINWRKPDQNSIKKLALDMIEYKMENKKNEKNFISNK